MHANEEGIPIAVQRYGFHVLHVAGGVSLTPKFVAGSGPVRRAAIGERAVEGFVVHPPHHEHLLRFVVLNNRAHQARSVTFELPRNFRI